MAGDVPANLLSTFDVGFFPNTTAIHHEDLTDLLTILDSYQTPFFSGAPKGRAKDMVHSWVVDTLAATTTAGSFEGTEHSGDTLTKPVRIVNGLQLFRRDVTVSDRERESNPAGIRDMYEHQIMKEFKVLARNVEATIFATAASATGAEATSTTAPHMHGIRAFSITVSGVSAGVTTGDIVRLSRTMFENGAEPDSIWFSPQAKQQFVDATISAGTTINTRNIAATDQKLIANIDVFESPFNQLYAVITDRFIASASASGQGLGYFIGDRGMGRIMFFRPPQHKQMGKSGDNTKGIVLMELTLQLDHPSAWGAVTGLTGT